MGWVWGGVDVWGELKIPRSFSAAASTGDIYTQLAFVGGDGPCVGRRQVS